MIQWNDFMLEFYSAFPLDGVRGLERKWAVHFYCFHKKIVGGLQISGKHRRKISFRNHLLGRRVDENHCFAVVLRIFPQRPLRKKEY
jgi:hypothetical protein